MSLRAEVALLSRNVRILGSTEENGTQDFGAHVMMLKLDRAHFEYVEWHHVGQAHQLGRYPIHFHVSGVLKVVDEQRALVRGCAVHRTFNRALTNHATDGLLVEDTVAYNVQGMAFFFEDAAERGAVYQRNLAMMVRRSFSLLQVDLTPAGFWITHPGNSFIGNHAVGSHNFGFWYDIRFGPQFLSAGRKGIYPPYTGVTRFENNTAHSCGERGIWVFNLDPRTDPSQEAAGERAVTVMLNMKTWGNAAGFEGGFTGPLGVPPRPVGHLHWKGHMSISDGMEGVVIAIGIADQWAQASNGWNGPLVENALIMGESELPREMWTECAIAGPSNDYQTFKGTHFLDSFSKGFFCGCKWCPFIQTGGVEVRFLESKFHQPAARDVVFWRDKFDSLVWDQDGTLTGLPKCAVHGCWLHPDIDGGLGYFPTEHCTLHKFGIACTMHVGLRTLRLRHPQPNGKGDGSLRGKEL